jgi:hypothetical protein
VRSNNGSGDRIIISLRTAEDPGQTTIMVWNLFGKDGSKSNYEKNHVTVSDPYFVTFDQEGNTSVVHLEEP